MPRMTEKPTTASKTSTKNDDSDIEVPALEKIAGLSEYLPPSSIEAEMSVLGSMLLGEPEAIEKAAELLSVKDFYREAHGRIYQAMLRLRGRSEPIDTVTLKDELDSMGFLAQCGGVLYIMQLAEYVPTPANIVYYAGIVKDKAIRRRSIKQGLRLIKSCFKDTPDEIVKGAQNIALGVLSDVRQNALSHAGDAVSGAIEKMLDPDPGIFSGVEDLDWILGGITKGTLTVLAADPGAGKTQLAIQYAISAAQAEKEKAEGGVVVFMTVEMPQESLAQRMILRTAQIDSMELKRNRGKFVTTAQRDAYKKAAIEIAGLPLYFRDQKQAPIEAGTIPGLVKQIHIENYDSKLKRGGVALFVIDYLQAIKPSSDSPRDSTDERRVSEISTMLRDLSVELDIPVLAVSSTSRNGELRHSGQINYDAHNIVFIEAMDKKPRDPKDTTPVGVTIEIRKQRDGMTGMVKASFVKKFGFFAGYSDREWGVTGEKEMGKF